MGYCKQSFEVIKGKITTEEKEHISEMLKKGKEMAFFNGSDCKFVDKSEGNIHVKLGTKLEPINKKNRYSYRIVIIKLIKN